MKYEAYADYKDSGVEWLGIVPAHWDIKKLKFIANVQPSNIDKKTKETDIPVLLCNYTDVYYNDKVSPAMEFMKASATEEQIKRFTLRAGDTVITKDSEDPNDIAIPSFVPEDITGVVCGYHLAVIRPYEIGYGEFIKRLFECGYARAYFATRSNGLTRYGLGTFALDNICYPKPPKQEALTIANFLDHETAKIDTLIEKQQQLIKLLKEKRQAVISHAVTKGLNPNAPMRDSGVEWLGEVPAHWEVYRVKHLSFLISKGTTPSTIGGDFVDEGIRFLKAENIGKSLAVQSTPSFYITEKVDEQISRSRLKEHDVLVIIAGATTGLSSIVSRDVLPANTNQAVSFIRPLKQEFSILILRWLSTEFAQRIIWMGAVQAAQPNLSMEDLGNIPIVVPPIDELNKIMSIIDSRLMIFDHLILKAESAIELMQERRTALISAAVTGKIDVRNWQAPETLQSNIQTHKEE